MQTETAITPASDTTTVAVFSNQQQANLAVDALITSGFTLDHIGVLSRDHTDGSRLTPVGETADHSQVENIGTGAAAAAIAGAGVGALVGWGVLAGTVPVIGPALLAGTLGILASNAASGAAVAGVIGALTGWGVSEEHARHYESEVAAGRVVVTVFSDDRTDEARAILRQYGAISKEPWLTADEVQ